MTSNPVHRLRTAAVAVVFLGAAGFAGEEVHECSHHAPRFPDGGAAASVAQGLAESGGHGHRGPQEGKDVAPSADADHGAEHQHDSGDPCTCVGDCHGTAAAPVPVSGPIFTVPMALPWGDSEFSGTGRIPAGPAPYLFPFPNPPPLAP